MHAPTVREIDPTHYVIGIFHVTAVDIESPRWYWKVEDGTEVVFTHQSFAECRIYVERTYRMNPDLPLVYRPTGR